MDDTRRQCTATNRSGNRCGRAPIIGGTVCKAHGGGAPQVIRAARLRLAELVEPAIATLAREMRDADESRDRIRAAVAVLDRAGLRPRPDGLTADEARDVVLGQLIALRDQLDQ